MNNDLSIIYYSSNYLETKHPEFVRKTRENLLKVKGDIPLISVSQRPMDFGENVCVGEIGRSHFNIYRQILEGCKRAKTKWVAMAEDDILYSDSHFHPFLFIKHPKDDTFYYDMNKVSMFTWTRPQIFSYRSKRQVVNHLIAPREMLIDALTERFARLKVLVDQMGIEHPEIEHPELRIQKYWGDPGRYEDLLGVTVRKTDTFYAWRPSIVFSHEFAYGYEMNQGKKKKHGDLRIVELADWGRADKIYHDYYE